MDAPGRDDFAPLVAKMIADKFPLVSIEVSPSDFALKINGNLAPLENLYRLSQHDPAAVRHQAERWVVELLRAAEGHPDERQGFPGVKDRILPIVLPQTNPDSGPKGVMQPLIAGLQVAYAIDNDRSITYIPEITFKKWNLTLEDLHQTALNNLMEKSDGMTANAAQDEDGEVTLVLVQTLDGYDASRILLPTLHEQLRPMLGSPFLAGIPNRDILVCFRNTPELVNRLRTQIAQDYQTMPHQLSEKIFQITADGIAPFDE